MKIHTIYRKRIMQKLHVQMIAVRESSKRMMSTVVPDPAAMNALAITLLMVDAVEESFLVLALKKVIVVKGVEAVVSVTIHLEGKYTQADRSLNPDLIMVEKALKTVIEMSGTVKEEIAWKSDQIVVNLWFEEDTEVVGSLPVIEVVAAAVEVDNWVSIIRQNQDNPGSLNAGIANGKPKMDV